VPRHVARLVTRLVAPLVVDYSVQGREGWSWCREEEIPQQGGRICSGFITADVSPRPNPNKECKKSKAKTEDLLALVNNGFFREKEMDMWRAAAGDPYPMEKNPDEIPMFARFVERRLALLVCDFFKGLLKYYGIEYLNLNPNGIFTSPSSSTSAKPSWGSSPTAKLCTKQIH
jgi:hypothetical protein